MYPSSLVKQMEIFFFPKHQRKGENKYYAAQVSNWSRSSALLVIDLVFYTGILLTVLNVFFLKYLKIF